MSHSLFKRSKGEEIPVPGGGRTRRTVAKVPASHHTLPRYSSSDSSSQEPPISPSPSTIFDFHCIGVDEKGPQDETHSQIRERERLSNVVNRLSSAGRTPLDDQRDVLHPSVASNKHLLRLSQGFLNLNEAIVFFCNHTAGWALRNWPFEGIDNPTTENANLVALKASFPQGDSVPSLIVSKMNSPRPLDHVLNFGLRSIISKALHQDIFDPFHPSLSLRIGGEEGARRSELLKELQDSTRSQEDDIDIMPWRAGTFKALEIKAGRDFEETFIKDLLSALIKDHIFPFLQAIFHDRMNILPFQLEDVTSIIRAAFEWNRSIKCLVPPLDLRTFIAPNNAPFDAEMMEYYEKPMGASRMKTIICAGSSGLKLFDREHPDGLVLVKVKVVTPQNYGDA